MFCHLSLRFEDIHFEKRESSRDVSVHQRYVARNIRTAKNPIRNSSTQMLTSIYNKDLRTIPIIKANTKRKNKINTIIQERGLEKIGTLGNILGEVGSDGIVLLQLKYKDIPGDKHI